MFCQLHHLARENLWNLCGECLQDVELSRSLKEIQQMFSEENAQPVFRSKCRIFTSMSNDIFRAPEAC